MRFVSILVGCATKTSSAINHHRGRQNKAKQRQQTKHAVGRTEIKRKIINKNEAPNQFSPHLLHSHRGTNFPPKKCIGENIFVVVRATKKKKAKTIYI